MSYSSSYAIDTNSAVIENKSSMVKIQIWFKLDPQDNEITSFLMTFINSNSDIEIN